MRHAVGQLFSGALVSKVVGLLREIAFAAWFGTGDFATAWRIAQSALLLPLHALSGEALGAGLVRQYRQARLQSPQMAQMVTLVGLCYLGTISVLVFSLLWLQAQSISRLIAPGASEGVLFQAAQLMQVLALAAPFYMLSSALAWLEAVHGRYSGLSWRPLVLNLGALLGAVLVVKGGHQTLLAWGLVAGHVLAALLGLRGFLRLDRLWPVAGSPKASFVHVAKGFFLPLPMLLALPLLGQISLWVERIVASHMQAGTIVATDYARLLCETAVHLTAMPLAIVALASGADHSRHRRNMSGLLVIGLMLSLGLTGLAKPITSLLFERAAFDAKAVALTAQVLGTMGLAAGVNLPALYLSKALLAEGRVTAALRIALCAFGSAILVNLTMGPYLGPSALGLALLAQALVTLVSGAWALRLWPSDKSLLPCLILAALGHLLLDWLGGGLLVGLYWVGLFITLPPLRRAILGVLARG